MRRRALLLGAGLVSEAVYLALAWRLPWWRYGGSLNSWASILGDGPEILVLCLAGVGVLLAAFLAGWWVVRRGAAGRWIVWGFAGLFSATLFWLLPITSDLFTYLSQAHLLTDVGANPLLVSALDVPGDRLLQAYPALYATNPSVYGPAWTLLSSVGTLGRYDVVAGLLYLKGLALVAWLGCGWLVERILRQVRPARALEGLYLLAWNPLVLLLAVGDGHNDIVMMGVALLGLWLLLRERWALAFGALALSVWIKYVSVIFLPLFVIYTWRWSGEGRGRHPRTILVQGALAFAGVSVLAFAPFWSPEMLSGIAARLLRPINWQGGGGGASSWALVVGLALFAAVYAVALWRMWRGPISFQRLANAGFVLSLAAFVLGAARSQPWHLIWPAVLAGLSDWKWAAPVVAGLSAVMLAAQVWVEWGAPGIG